MNAAQCIGKCRVGVALEPCRVLPFGEFRHALERKLHSLAHLVGMQAFGERIDRIEERQPRQTRRIDHPIGMHHLQMAVIERGSARDVAQFALRQELLQIIFARIEIGDGERVRLVAGVDVVGRPRPVRRRRPVPVDGDGDRYDGVGLNLAKFRLVAPIDKPGRQMKQQIDDARRFAVASDEPREQLLQPRPDPRKCRQRSKKRIEQRRAHCRLFYTVIIR